MSTPTPVPVPTPTAEPSVEQILTSRPVSLLVLVIVSLVVLTVIVRMIASTWRLMAAVAVIVFLTIWTQAQCDTRQANQPVPGAVAVVGQYLPPATDPEATP